MHGLPETECCCLTAPLPAVLLGNTPGDNDESVSQLPSIWGAGNQCIVGTHSFIFMLLTCYQGKAFHAHAQAQKLEGIVCLEISSESPRGFDRGHDVAGISSFITSLQSPRRANEFSYTQILVFSHGDTMFQKLSPSFGIGCN